VTDLTYEEMFKKATGFDPYPYQLNLASSSIDELSRIINIPTGMGKTLAIVMYWIYYRRLQSDKDNRRNIPRRLIYCLPMRVLVEQVAENIVKWLDNLGLLAGKLDNNCYTPDFRDQEKIAVIVLMGGEPRTKWDIYPEMDMIIIGTQDMLLSREINRGYSMSIYRWPIHFGLFNNDALWVMDEIQLMGSGFFTSMQMEAFRKIYGNYGIVRTIWMSATAHENMFNTVDFSLQDRQRDFLNITEKDRQDERVKKLLESGWEVSKIEVDVKRRYRDIALNVIENHRNGTASILIMNTVEGAQKTFMEIEKEVKKRMENGEIEILLLHSLFRPPERAKIVDKIIHSNGRNKIIVSTQVIEAGVDISSHNLFTEVAPWSSLVQRFGRCNRNGEFDDAKIFWIDYGNKLSPYINETEQERIAKLIAPYEEKEIKNSIDKLNSMTGTKQNRLAITENMSISLGNRFNIIRRKDIDELFDYTSEMFGNRVNVSGFIRDNKDEHVYVFWRDFSENYVKEPLPDEGELCPAHISDVKEMLISTTKGKKVKEPSLLTFDEYSGQWKKLTDPKDVYPGMTIMMHISGGHYDEKYGWTDIVKSTVKPVVKPNNGFRNAGYDENILSENKQWKTITEHTQEVSDKVERIAKEIGLNDSIISDLKQAAIWHDYGKAHPAFQSKISKVGMPDALYAKAPNERWVSNGNNSRKYFRHELVSGLAALSHCKGGNRNLVAYLAASHHGKVRISIRSLPDEVIPDDLEKKFARGVWDGDYIPPVILGDNYQVPAYKIDLSPMIMGDGSWVSMSLSLCNPDNGIGIFRLSFLEALLRAADERISGGY